MEAQSNCTEPRKSTKHIFECNRCGGDVIAYKSNGKFHSCNIRRCDGCKHLFYAKGLLQNCKEKPFQAALSKYGLKVMFADILKGVELKERPERYTGVHGSSKDEEINVVWYLSPLTAEWTTRERALRDYVFSQLAPIINEAIKDYEV